MRSPRLRWRLPYYFTTLPAVNQAFSPLGGDFVCGDAEPLRVRLGAAACETRKPHRRMSRCSCSLVFIPIAGDFSAVSRLRHLAGAAGSPCGRGAEPAPASRAGRPRPAACVNDCVPFLPRGISLLTPLNDIATVWFYNVISTEVRTTVRTQWRNPPRKGILVRVRK